MGYYMQDRVDRPWPYTFAASISQLSMAVVRQAMHENNVNIPNVRLYVEKAKQQKQNDAQQLLTPLPHRKQKKKFPRRAKVIKRPAASKRPASAR